MKTIDVTYRHLGFFPYTYKGHIPESWSEINQKQLIAVAQTYVKEQAQISFVSTFTGIPLWIIKNMDEYEIYTILKEIEFIFDFKAKNGFIIPSINGYQAPLHNMDGMEWGQFIYVDTYFDQFMGQQNDESLNKFFTHLYLRKNEAFDHSLCVSRINKKSITKIPFATKFAVVLNYRLLRDWFEVKYPLVFQKQKEVKNAEPQTVPLSEAEVPNAERQTPNTKLQQTDWLRVHESIVGENITEYDKYAKLPLHTILRYLTRKIKENVKK